MTKAAELVALRARLVLPISSPPIRSGVITVCGDRIVAVGENVSGRTARDLGDVAILPAFVNAHTHLELSDCGQPNRCAGYFGCRSGFSNWYVSDARNGRRESTCRRVTRRHVIADSSCRWLPVSRPLGTSFRNHRVDQTRGRLERIGWHFARHSGTRPSD